MIKRNKEGPIHNYKNVIYDMYIKSGHYYGDILVICPYDNVGFHDGDDKINNVFVTSLMRTCIFFSSIYKNIYKAIY